MGKKVVKLRKDLAPYSAFVENVLGQLEGPNRLVQIHDPLISKLRHQDIKIKR
jgi:hypothetical protein